MKASFKEHNTNDRIEGGEIIIYDRDTFRGPKTIKDVKIITPQGVKKYKIKRTVRGGYLFN
jgi:hypothetical protein